MSHRTPLVFLLISLILTILFLSVREEPLAQARMDSQALHSIQPAGPLTVGLYHAPPFAIKTQGAWDGLAVHLWREISQELDREYEFQEIEREAVPSGLQEETVDLVITAVATTDQEEEIDFTHSYFNSALGLAELRQQSFWEIVGAVFSPRFIQVSLWLAVVFAIIGVLVWLFERKANEEQFGGGGLRGPWAGFWWAGVTMSTIGYGDKAPLTVGGRILALIWMLVAMGITASLTATVTSVLSFQSGLGSTTFTDLREKEVGSVADSATAAYLEEERIQFEAYPTPLAGLKAVQNREIETFVYDAAVLRFVNNEEMNNHLRIITTAREIQRHAFALAPDHPLRESLNRKLLEKTNTSAWREIVERYLPPQGN